MTSVVVVTQDDPFYMPSFFETFFDEVPSNVTIESVVLLRPFDESKFELAHRLYDFYGLGNFLKLASLYATRKLRDELGQAVFSVERLAKQKGVSTEHRETVNDPAFAERIENVDVVLSVASPEIFDSVILRAPEWGCVNVHTADLPDYRGMMPTFWALYHGEDEIGVTVHTMTEEIDRGKIVRKATFPVDEDDTLSDVITRGKETGGVLAAQALSDIASEDVSMTTIDGDGAYYSFPTARERQELTNRGRELL